MQRSRTAVEFDIFAGLNIIENSLLVEISLLHFIIMGPAAAKNDQVPLESQSCMAETTFEIVRLHIFSDYSPDEID